MKDIITNIVNKYDLAGKYLDTLAVEELNDYFKTASDRIKTVEFINSQSSKIVEVADCWVGQAVAILSPYSRLQL